MHKWLEVLYSSEAFVWYHGWTREMLEIFFRETKNGRLYKTYTGSVSNCRDGGLKDCLIPTGEIFALVLESGVFKR